MNKDKVEKHTLLGLMKLHFDVVNLKENRKTIDYKNKVVFNGSDLGKEYSVKGVIERIAQRIVKGQDVQMIQRPKIINSLSREQKEDLNMAGEKEKSRALETTMALLMRLAKNDNIYLIS